MSTDKEKTGGLPVKLREGKNLLEQQLPRQTLGHEATETLPITNPAHTSFVG